MQNILKCILIIRVSVMWIWNTVRLLLLTSVVHLLLAYHTLSWVEMVVFHLCGSTFFPLSSSSDITIIFLHAFCNVMSAQKSKWKGLHLQFEYILPRSRAYTPSPLPHPHPLYLSRLYQLFKKNQCDFSLTQLSKMLVFFATFKRVYLALHLLLTSNGFFGFHY